jgi:hypothetical protein
MFAEFKDWFYYDLWWGICDAAEVAIAVGAKMLVKLLKALLIGLKYMLIAAAMIATCPIWIIPFVYWYFREWRNREEEDT